MRRRRFCALLAGAAAFSPLAAQAQQPEKVRRIGVLFSTVRDDASAGGPRAFLEALRKLGWAEE